MSVDQEIPVCLNQQLDQAFVKIRHCLQQLTDQQIWWRPRQSMNSIGNLLLHQCGNLRQWAITGVGGEPDTRNRQAEFSQTEIIPVDELLAEVERTVAAAKQVIAKQTRSSWSRCLQVQNFDVSVLEALLHTTTHFVGHTHQIILLTRWQLRDRYRFHWTPQTGRDNLPL